MQRRNFNQILLRSAVFTTMSPMSFPHKNSAIPVLKPGMKVALIAPAGPVFPERLDKALANMESLGLIPVVNRGVVLNQYGYLAGPDADRLADLHAAFSRSDVDVVWCIRGGYGCTRLLPAVNYRLIKKSKKPLIGFSDVTALHLAFAHHGIRHTIHGPVASATFTAFTLSQVQEALFLPPHPFTIPSADSHQGLSYVIHSGQAEGQLTGGNLSLLAALCGTGYRFSFKHKIVFLEDVGEKPYRLDRFITQLLQSTDLADAAGIVLGIFADCEPDEGDPSLSLRAMLEDKLKPLGIPTFYGLSFGHVDDNCCLPYHQLARLDATQQSLTLLA